MRRAVPWSVKGGGLASRDGGTDDGLAHIAFDGNLQECPRAGTVSVGNGECDGVKPRFLEGVGGGGCTAGRSITEVPLGLSRSGVVEVRTVSGGKPSVTEAVIFASGRSFSPGLYGVKR